MLLRSVEVRMPPVAIRDRYPFTVPTIAALLGRTIPFTTPITFLVGENGSGKSTLLEAMALAIGSIALGRDDGDRDRSLVDTQPLADQLRLVWNHKTKRGFFLRAEDFFGYAQRLSLIREEYLAELKKLDEDTTLSKRSRDYAKMPYGAGLADLQRLYGPGLERVSHGESFLRLMRSRINGPGLYLCDEPEAPLSPMRQLALLTLIEDAAREHGAQFLIATHSPIVLATRGATILECTSSGLRVVAYGDLEHVRFTRDFLQAPDQFLQHI